MSDLLLGFEPISLTNCLTLLTSKALPAKSKYYATRLTPGSIPTSQIVLLLKSLTPCFQSQTS